MKRGALIIFISAILILFQYAAIAYNPPVIDEADYLTEVQEDNISQRLSDIRSRYNMDVAVVIESYMNGRDAESRSDDIFDYNGYGAGAEKDGILFYISREPRRYGFSTHGAGMTAFNDRGLEYIEERVLPLLRQDDYYGAVSAYADASEMLLEYYAEGSPYDEKDMKSVIIAYAAAFLLPLIIALAATAVKLRKMNTVISNDYADSYMKPGSMKVTQSRDLYLYSVVNRTKRESSSGGGGSHRSSGGETHGGRSGSY